MVMKVPEIEPVDITLSVPDVKCTKPGCESDNCKYYQRRERKTGGFSHRYRCADCGARFTWRPGFLGRHYPENVITDALDNSVEERSLAGTCRGIKNRSYPGVKNTPVRSTIFRWINDSNQSMAKIPASISIPVNSKISTDEIFLRTRGLGAYMYATMESDSLFVTAYDISTEEKLQYDATALFEEAVQISSTTCSVLISDKLPGFSEGFKNVIAADCKRLLVSKPTACHIGAACIRKRHINNNCRERLNGIIKDRIKTVRGFKSMNPALIGIMITYYNFLRPHGGLNGSTPAEKLGIKVKGSNKWYTLLAFASTL